MLATMRRSMSLHRLVSLAWLAAAVLLAFPAAAPAQNLPPGIIGGGVAPGVWVEPDGTVKHRELDEKTELTAMRARAKAAQDTATKGEKLAYVSLPKAVDAARVASDAGKPVPDDAKYLGGLTQIRFVFLYPETNDLVVAGPAELVHVVDEQHAVGMKTGRPAMRLEDFVVAMHVVRDARGQAFGCRLDPDPAAPARISDAMAKLARASRADRVKAVAAATGPQKVSFFGRVPDDTRFALATIAADYELKRYGLGLARSTLPDLGNGVDNTRRAVNMWWYELAYEPILVSPEGDAFGFRGPRLKVQAGSFDWDPKGATPKAFEFAKRMSQHMEMLATTQPLVADLQNLADLSVLSALIQRDRLDRKVNWDTGWVMRDGGDKAASFPVAKVTVPKTADALANYTNGSIAAGGVVLSPAKALAAPPEKDGKGALAAARKQGAELRKDKAGVVAVQQGEVGR
jgi:hypothetical protein